MSKRETNNKVTGYDVRIASQSYSNISAILAGFAFAAFVLVVQSKLPKENLQTLQTLRDRATIGFIAAFFGCILSSFTFAVIAGDREYGPRSHYMATLGGCGLAISTGFVLWSVIALSRIYLSPELSNFVTQAFPLLYLLIAPAYLAFSSLDPIIASQNRFPTRNEYLQVIVPSYIPILIGCLIRWFDGSPYSYLNSIGLKYFNAFIVIAIFFMILSSIGTMYLSNQDQRIKIDPIILIICIFLTLSLISVMFLMI